MLFIFRMDSNAVGHVDCDSITGLICHPLVLIIFKVVKVNSLASIYGILPPAPARPRSAPGQERVERWSRGPRGPASNCQSRYVSSVRTRLKLFQYYQYMALIEIIG